VTFEDDYNVLLSTFARCFQLHIKGLDRDGAIRRIAELCAITETQMNKYGVTASQKMQVLGREAYRPPTLEEIDCIWSNG
jgi:hypothetical protein